MRIVKSKSWEALEIAKVNSIWGSKKKLSNWLVGEKIIFLVEDDGVSLGEVSGEQYYTEEVLWQDDLYSWRIPITFKSQISGEKGRDFQKKLRLVLKSNYGKTSGSLILFRLKLPDYIEREIEDLIRKEY